ncbi:cytosolic sulfotransferase 17-like [Neltuma alba]|uniref:cytosolic sulfotransferase 17-like n=1 Tax=Neltuma alba TaxID=207710 RepID=UPI0010A30B7C|nr:cytosolic sulfotransferase 17-like [Prosopis alba]
MSNSNNIMVSGLPRGTCKESSTVKTTFKLKILTSSLSLHPNQAPHGSKPLLLPFSTAGPIIQLVHIWTTQLKLVVLILSSQLILTTSNPKDLFVSGWQFANKIRSETRGSISIQDSFGKLWKESLVLGRSGIICWGTTWRVWRGQRRYAFEDEEENGNVVENILKPCSLESLRNLEENKSGKTKFGVVNNAYFRQGAVGDWQNFLALDMMKRS